MTALVAAALLTLAILDGAFSGFRSSLGRTGLIRHQRSDVVAAQRGVVLTAVVLTPTVAFLLVDVLARGASLDDYKVAGEAALLVFVPYASVTFLALGAYTFLGWRKKYLASALVLGPFTLVRPVVIAAGAVAGVLQTSDASIAMAAVLAALGVLAIEPLSAQRWYASAETRD